MHNCNFTNYQNPSSIELSKDSNKDLNSQCDISFDNNSFYNQKKESEYITDKKPIIKRKPIHYVKTEKLIDDVMKEWQVNTKDGVLFRVIQSLCTKKSVTQRDIILYKDSLQCVKRNLEQNLGSFDNDKYYYHNYANEETWFFNNKKIKDKFENIVNQYPHVRQYSVKQEILTYIKKSLVEAIDEQIKIIDYNQIKSFTNLNDCNNKKPSISFY